MTPASRRHSIRVLFCILSLLVSAIALAHEVRPAYLQITAVDKQPDIQYEILWKQPIVQSGRLRIDPIFPEACELRDQSAPEVTPDALIHRWVTTCDLSQGLIHIKGLSATLTDVMVRIKEGDGKQRHYLLRPENPTLDLSRQTASTFGYISIGFEHLVLGIDHVLFVIGLVLFIRAPLALLKTITAFTLAHSVTLALSILGWVTLKQGPVEAVIALSILFLARELVLEESKQSALTRGRPWLMALLFGLLHGLGFAGALKDIGLPEDELWLSLLLFNVGIELGQLLIIGLVLGMGWLVTKVWNAANLIRFSAYAMGCMAAFWTIDRTLILM